MQLMVKGFLLLCGEPFSLMLYLVLNIPLSKIYIESIMENLFELIELDVKPNLVLRDSPSF